MKQSINRPAKITNNRLVGSMNALRERQGKAFIAYIMAGEPSWESTRDIVLSLEDIGVTAVELGVPFSDPIADGPVIQKAANRALAGGVTLASIYDHVERIREHTDIPIVLMGYWNVFLQYGREKSIERAVIAGIDGFIIADLPPEAEPDFFAGARESGLCTVLLASELTGEERLGRIAAATTGFLYYVPQMGITGLSLSITESVKARVRKIKTLTDQPVCIGLGVKTREDVSSLYEAADGVIVGTRIVEHIEAHRDQEDIGSLTARFVKTLMPRTD